MSFPRYPEYKDSGVEWLGMMPAHWVRSALKYLASYQNGHPFKPEDWGSDGRPIIRIAQLTGDADPDRFLGIVDDRVSVSDGDLLFSWSATLDSFFWHGEPAWLNQHIFKVAPTAEGCKEYLYYLIKFWAPKLADVDAHGSTMRHIKKESLGQRVYAPPIQEQAAIARFLDHETTKIDALIADQEKLIALLKEKRQAVTSHAVTKGLDPNVPMKDSGVEWLGEVPAHWRHGALSRIAERVVVGIAEAATHAYADEGIPILRSTNIRPGRIVGEVLRIDPLFAEDRGSKLINAGDLVTVRTGNAGVTAAVPDELDGCQCFTMLITTLGVGYYSPYFCYFMNSAGAQQYFTLEGWGTAQVNISVPILKMLPVPIPPESEQKAITAYLEAELLKLDSLVSSSETGIGLLRERRAALISAAVTGQIDVRQAAPPAAIES